LGESDDDAFRTPQEAQPVDVLVLGKFADKLGAVVAQAGDDVVDVLDGEHYATYTERVRWRIFWLGLDRRRGVESRQLHFVVAVRGTHHNDVGTDALEPNYTVRPRPLDRRLAFQFHTKFHE